MHKFFFLLLQQIWNIEQEKDREKEKVGGRPAKLNEKKGDRGLEREIKNRGDIFWSCKTTAKNVQKKRAVRAKLLFLLIIDRLLFFTVLRRCLPA